MQLPIHKYLLQSIHKSIIIKERIKIYEKIKRIAALIAAVLMTVTMFTSAMTVSAATKSKSATIKCAGYNSRCSLTSANNRSAKASTVCFVHKYPSIYAAILCAKYNKKY